MSSRGPEWQTRNGTPARRGVRMDVVAVVAVSIAALVAAGFWVNLMITPVHRVGNPSLPPTPTLSLPTPTPSQPATPSPSPKPSQTPTVIKTPTLKSSGQFVAANLNINSSASTGTLRTYRVVAETSAGVDVNAVATQIAAVLNDPRSWAGGGNDRFALVADPAQASFVITIASPATAGKACALANGSCLVGTAVWVDAASWRVPPATYVGNAGGWHAYQVNRSVGGLLGKKAATCAGPGKPAPVMAPQQGDLAGCLPNPWPFP